MGEILKEFYEAVTYIKSKGWETLIFIDCEITGKPIVPYIAVKLSQDLTLNVILNDTYYIDINYKTEEWCKKMLEKEGKIPTIAGMIMFGQVQYSPEGNLLTTKEELNTFKNRMTEKEGELFIQFVKDLYYFFKPNSINFIME